MRIQAEGNKSDNEDDVTVQLDQGLNQWSLHDILADDNEDNNEATTEASTGPIPFMPTITMLERVPRRRPGYQRAKSKDELPTLTLRTRNDSVSDRSTFEVSDHRLRHRRSPSPASLFATATHSWRRASSYGSLHHLDPDLLAN